MLVDSWTTTIAFTRCFSLLVGGHILRGFYRFLKPGALENTISTLAESTTVLKCVSFSSKLPVFKKKRPKHMPLRGPHTRGCPKISQNAVGT